MKINLEIDERIKILFNQNNIDSYPQLPELYLMFYCFSRHMKPLSMKALLLAYIIFHRLTGDNLYMHVAHFDPVLI